MALWQKGTETMLTPALPSGDERRVPGAAALPGRPRILLGHGAGDRDDALSPPGRRSGAESAALSPDHDHGMRVGAVFNAVHRNGAYSPEAQEDGHPARLARARALSQNCLFEAKSENRVLENQ